MNTKNFKVFLQIKIGKEEFRKIDLGGDMNYVETNGLSLAFIHNYSGEPSITYVVNPKRDTVRFEFGERYYNVYINS